jgi:predicted nucleotidyltransferase
MIGPSHAAATSVHAHNDPPSTPCASIATTSSTSSTSSTSFGGRNVRVFGSVTRGEAHSGSDVDQVIDVPAGTGLDTVERIADALDAVLPGRHDRRRLDDILAAVADAGLIAGRGRAAFDGEPLAVRAARGPRMSSVLLIHNIGAARSEGFERQPQAD